MSKKNMKAKFDELLAFEDETEKVEFEATMLAMHFLGLVDAEMERRNISKKDLAAKVGTSPAFITQMFRADRKPSWTMLAKMQEALNLQFKIFTEQELQKRISEEIMEYHRRWEKTLTYLSSQKNASSNTEDMPSYPNKDFALAA